jgi:hypothetical protein
MNTQILLNIKFLVKMKILILQLKVVLLIFLCTIFIKFNLFLWELALSSYSFSL